MIRDTTIKAWLNEIAPTLQAREVQILEVFEREPDRTFTNSELAALLGWQINRITGRVKHLREITVLEDAGRRACRVTQRDVHAWKLRIALKASKLPMEASVPTFRQFQSESVVGARHVVKQTEEALKCSCAGFMYRGNCKHVRKIIERQQKAMTTSLFAEIISPNQTQHHHG